MQLYNNSNNQNDRSTIWIGHAKFVPVGESHNLRGINYFYELYPYLISLLNLDQSRYGSDKKSSISFKNVNLLFKVLYIRFW
jgi:hypothetical protein